MLFIEIRTNNNEITDLEPGTYNLNSPLNSNIFICEYHRPRNINNSNDFISDQRNPVETTSIIFNGYVTVKDKKDFKIFHYKTLDKFVIKNTYLEEYFPNEKYIEYYRSVMGDNRQKYEILKNCERILKLSRKTSEFFGINRCVLFYGEPGVGKSTFSKALVQKLSIRMNRQLILRTIH